MGLAYQEAATETAEYTIRPGQDLGCEHSMNTWP